MAAKKYRQIIQGGREDRKWRGKKKRLNEQIHVVYITDETYAMPTAVSISSIKAGKDRRSDYIVHIFVREISEDTRLKLKSLQGNKFQIDIIDVELEDEFLNYTKADGDLHVTPSAILKFRIPSVLKDTDKVIYIDGDTVVCRDLWDLYDTDLKDSYVAAVKDIISERNPAHLQKIGFTGKYYFNSGVMLMNLSKMREDGITDRLVDYRLHGKNHFMDQDALNQVLKDHVLYVSVRYNFLNKFYEWWSRERLSSFYGEEFEDNLEAALSKAAVIHFGSHEKPWIYEMGVCSDIFMKYYEASPYGDVKLRLVENADTR